MNILGIETSCDETSVSIVQDGTKVISNVVSSSLSLHAKTGGIIPENAARQQISSMIPVLEEAINLTNNGKIKVSDIDAIAVTYGPGLIGSLLVGIETSRVLSYMWDKPLVPVNHLIGHIYANFIQHFGPTKEDLNVSLPLFPSLCLVVSGGHSDLVFMESHKKLSWIGGTRDDAAGEAFDKTARLLGLPYPGGPSISLSANKYLENNRQVKTLNLFPRPMSDNDSFDFSFSGLKTAVSNYVKANPDIDTTYVAANIQEAIVDSLIVKSIKAVKAYKPKSFLIAGGVAANERLREKLLDNIKEEDEKINFYAPPVKLCTDNATLIASSAYFRYEPIDWREIKPDPEAYYF